MIVANWNIKCNVNCPYCDNTIDIMSEIKDSFELLPEIGKTSDDDFEMKCPDCKRDFTVQGVEY